MKNFVKMAAKIAVAAVAAATAIIMWSGGVAHADSTWGDMTPFSGRQSTFIFGNPRMCVALNAGDGYFNNNTRVFEWECNGNNDQQWSLHFYGHASDGNALYQVINLMSRKCMEMRNANTANGTQVDQFTCGSGPIDAISTQLWEVAPSNIGIWLELQPYSALRLGANMCLDVAGGDTDNGTKVEQWTCNGGENQAFAGDPLGN